MTERPNAHPSPTVALWTTAEDDSLAGHVRATLAAFDVALLQPTVPTAEATAAAHATALRAAEAAGAALHIVLDSSDGRLAERLERLTLRPVLRVPVATASRPALAALQAAADRPRGTAAGTLALGRAGAINAALFAVAVLALADAGLVTRLQAYRQQQTAQVLAAQLP